MSDDATLLELHGREDIPVIEMRRFPSPRDLVSGNAVDYIKFPEPKRVNTDFDYKRMPQGNGATSPFHHLDEFAAVRATAAKMRQDRKDGRKGRRATPERVIAASAGMRLQQGEPLEAVYRRYVHTAIAHRVDGWQVPLPGTMIARSLGIEYRSKFANYIRRPFEPQKFPLTEPFEQVIREEAAKVGLVVTPEMLAVLTSPPSNRAA